MPQTEEQRIEQDNREGKPDIVDIYLNKGTETGTRNQTRDGIQNGTDDQPTIRRKWNFEFHSLRRTKGMSLSSQGQEQAGVVLSA